ncbi:MAG: benzoate-CoA ligase family protein [Candidatus Limnocylindria bacterium]
MPMEAGLVHRFIERHLDEGRAADVAIRTPSRALTYGELAAQVNRVGNALRDLGVEPEQRVAVLLADGVELAATFFGALKIGAVPVLLNTRLTADDYRGILSDARAKVLVVDETLAGIALRIQPELSRLASVLVVGAAPEGLASFERAVAAASAELVPEPMSLDDMGFWLYTSGTTGQPKAAIHARRTLLAAEHYGVQVLGVTPGDRIFATSRLFFAYALGNALLIPLLTGAETFLHPSWPDVPTAVGVARDFRPTLLFSVPTFYARLLRDEAPAEAFSSVRLFVSAGERLPEELGLSIERHLGAPVLDGIGATETIFMFLSNQPDLRRPGASGVEVPGTEARILDPEGGPVAPGERGVLWVKTPSSAVGYWNRVDQSRETFAGGWYRTRDVYSRDADGFFHHHGREDDYFKVAGMWVSPAALEQAILAHPGVVDAGAVGLPGEHGLIKPVAFIVPRDARADRDVLCAELEAFVAARVEPHQRPQRIVPVPELPRTATGKLQRYKLAALIPQATAR